MRGSLAFAALASDAQAGLAADPASAHTLWYTSEGRHWLEALPIGNGRGGGMVYGGITQERIALPESTVGSGASGVRMSIREV
jgi:alpha-L-fucosidase 2